MGKEIRYKIKTIIERYEEELKRRIENYRKGQK